jgi:hypothetical protein
MLLNLPRDKSDAQIATQSAARLKFNKRAVRRVQIGKS